MKAQYEKLDYRQVRFENLVTFECFQCGKNKTSKLLALVNDEKICNGCYGLLISKTIKK